jgi:hypothetical protein
MNSDLSQVFSQLPPALVANIIGVFVLLAVLILYFGLVRPAIKERRRKSQSEAPGFGLSQNSTVLSQTEAGRGDIEEPDFALLTALEPRRLGMTHVARQDGSQTDAQELLLLMRDEASGRLLLLLSGAALEQFSAADDPQRARFTSLMQEFAAQTGMVAMPAPADRPTPPPASDPDFRPTPPPVAPRPISTAPMGNFDLPKYREMEDTVKPGGFGRRSKVEHQPVPELNIAGAIESFLQHKLSITGGLPGHHVHVKAAPNGGVRIEVDGRSFEAVSDVSDPEIRQYLQDTIAEWQARQ